MLLHCIFLQDCFIFSLLFICRCSPVSCCHSWKAHRTRDATHRCAEDSFVEPLGTLRTCTGLNFLDKGDFCQHFNYHQSKRSRSASEEPWDSSTIATSGLEIRGSESQIHPEPSSPSHQGTRPRRLTKVGIREIIEAKN